MSNLIPVPFHQHSVLTLREGDKVLVAMKPICDELGVPWEGQRQRLKRDPVLQGCTCMMQVRLPDDPRTREVVFLELDYLNGWLFGIDANRAKPELRDTIIDYQRECYRVLAKHFRRDLSDELVAARKQNLKSETAHFARYPLDKEIRYHALQGQPYWYIARKVHCHVSTVGKALKRMLTWGFIDAHRLSIARMGLMGDYRKWLRQHVQQLELGF